uniref:Outer membrane transport energization protein ExbB n=1 Tax=Chlorobium chlorochromatii (strain CaD3) TaxID=340177 RepID=Q3AT53_CHLCH
MKQSLITALLIALTYAVSLGFYAWMGTMPHGTLWYAVWKGGWMVSVLLTLILLVIAYSVERLLAFNKAIGNGNLPNLVQSVQQDVQAGAIDRALERCNQHQSLHATVLGAVVERYKWLNTQQISEHEKRRQELEKAATDATTIAMPTLERNLVVLSTIASISTMVGLLGTTLGMIRAFAAMATNGAPDAAQLSLGISEALFNTALGICGGIFGIVAFNLLSNRVDRIGYEMDEAALKLIQTFATPSR